MKQPWRFGKIGSLAALGALLSLSALSGCESRDRALEDIRSDNETVIESQRKNEQPGETGQERSEDAVRSGETLDEAGYGDRESPAGVGGMGMSGNPHTEQDVYRDSVNDKNTKENR